MVDRVILQIAKCSCKSLPTSEEVFVNAGDPRTLRTRAFSGYPANVSEKLPLDRGRQSGEF
jgi:hypothetical protein